MPLRTYKPREPRVKVKIGSMTLMLDKKAVDDWLDSGVKLEIVPGPSPDFIKEKIVGEDK